MSTPRQTPIQKTKKIKKITQLLSLYAQYHQVEVKQLLQTRKREKVLLRNLFAYFLIRKFYQKVANIAIILKRDRTTMVHAMKSIEQLLINRTDKQLLQYYIQNLFFFAPIYQKIYFNQKKYNLTPTISPYVFPLLNKRDRKQFSYKKNKNTSQNPLINLEIPLENSLQNYTPNPTPNQAPNPNPNPTPNFTPNHAPNM
jgi:hypothetical protein